MSTTEQRGYLSQEDFEEALGKLEPIAMEVLERQLRSEDERIAQNAAKLLIELRRGKPKQQIDQKTDQVTVIRYESAAWQPAPHEIEDAEYKALPAGDNGG
jgi:hypothetical protein